MRLHDFRGRKEFFGHSGKNGGRIDPDIKSLEMKFVKYHALGNDYLVIPPPEPDSDLSQEQIQRLCHRNHGPGADGILLGPLPSETCDFRLRIFNPDGSEAEKSGNGLRIFARFLWDEGVVLERPFTVETPGGVVT